MRVLQVGNPASPAPPAGPANSTAPLCGEKPSLLRGRVEVGRGVPALAAIPAANPAVRPGGQRLYK